MKGDRFEQMAMAARLPDWAGASYTISNEVAASLLRKEHAAVRRMVMKYLRLNDHGKLPKYNGTPVHGYRAACADILAALDQRAKGVR